MKTYSTKQAARLVGIHWVTLHHWLAAKKVRASQAFPIDGRKYWRGTEHDVARVRKYKEKFYRKGRGPKPKAKQ